MIAPCSFTHQLSLWPLRTRSASPSLSLRCTRSAPLHIRSSVTHSDARMYEAPEKDNSFSGSELVIVMVYRSVGFKC